jgi:predicted lipid carrier protein YhbT
MAETEFPILLATNVIDGLGLLPTPVLTRAMILLMRRLGRTYPQLFHALAAHEPCTVGIEPTDLRHRFVLSFGGKSVSLAPTLTLEQPLNACVKGRLATLVGLLEGRVDSDALFFSREIVITGDMEAIVSLRNALDRETVDVFQATTALFGPMGRPVRRIALMLERRLAAAYRRRTIEYEAFHAARRREHPIATDYDRMAAELQALKARVVKVEAQSRRRNAIGAVT